MAFNTIAAIGIILLATTVSARPSTTSSTSMPTSNWEDPYQDGRQGNAGARGMVCKKSLDAIHEFAADMMGKAIKSTTMDEYPIDVPGYGKLTIKAPRVTESKFGRFSYDMVPPNNIESQFYDGQMAANGVWQVKPNNGDTSGGTYKIQIRDARLNVTDQLLRGNDARPVAKVRECMADISNFRVEVQGSSPSEMRTALFSSRAVANNDNQSLVIDQCDTEMCFEVLAHFEKQICRLWQGFVDEVINKELQQIPTKMCVHGDHYRVDYSLLQREPMVNESSECIHAGMEGKYMWRNSFNTPFSPASMEWSNRNSMYSFQLSDFTFNTLFHQAHNSGHRFCASDVMAAQSSSSSTPAPTKPSKPSSPKGDDDQESSLSLNCDDDVDEDDMEDKAAPKTKSTPKSTSTRSTSTAKSSTTKSTRTSKSSSTKTSPTSKSSTTKSSTTKTSPTSKSSTTRSSTTKKSTPTSKSSTTKSTSSSSTTTAESSSPSSTHAPRKARPTRSTKSSTTKSTTSPTTKTSPTSKSTSTKTSPTSKSSTTKSTPTSRSSSTKTSPTSKSSTTKSTTFKSSSTTRHANKPRRGVNDNKPAKKCMGSLFANASNYGPYDANDMGDIVFKTERPIAIFLHSDKNGFFDASHGVVEFYGAIKGPNGQRPLLARANVQSMRGQFMPKLNNANITGMFKLDSLELGQSTRASSPSSNGFDLEAAAEFSKPWIERSMNAFLERYAQFPVPLPSKYECASPSMTIHPRTVQLDCEVRQQCQAQPTCRCFRDSCICSEPCEAKNAKGGYKRRAKGYKRQ